MNQRLIGHLTLGLALGLAQFAVMGVTAFLYVRHMRKNIDPVVRRLPCPPGGPGGRAAGRPGRTAVRRMVTVSASVADAFSLRLTFVLFLSVVVITLFTALLTAPQRDEISEFYLGNRDMSPLRNGLAMCGDYLSAATLLGSTGLVALTGYDGLLYLGGTVVAWMMVLLLIAEPCATRAGSPWATPWPGGSRCGTGPSGWRSPFARSPCAPSIWWPNWSAASR